MGQGSRKRKAARQAAAGAAAGARADRATSAANDLRWLVPGLLGAVGAVGLEDVFAVGPLDLRSPDDVYWLGRYVDSVMYEVGGACWYWSGVQSVPTTNPEAAASLPVTEVLSVQLQLYGARAEIRSIPVLHLWCHPEKWQAFSNDRGYLSIMATVADGALRIQFHASHPEPIGPGGLCREHTECRMSADMARACWLDNLDAVPGRLKT